MKTREGEPLEKNCKGYMKRSGAGKRGKTPPTIASAFSSHKLTANRMLPIP
jgi:hypothetical protein